MKPVAAVCDRRILQPEFQRRSQTAATDGNVEEIKEDRGWDQRKPCKVRKGKELPRPRRVRTKWMGPHNQGLCPPPLPENRVLHSQKCHQHRPCQPGATASPLDSQSHASRAQDRTLPVPPKNRTVPQGTRRRGRRVPAHKPRLIAQQPQPNQSPCKL